MGRGWVSFSRVCCCKRVIEKTFANRCGFVLHKLKDARGERKLNFLVDRLTNMIYIQRRTQKNMMVYLKKKQIFLRISLLSVISSLYIWICVFVCVLYLGMCARLFVCVCVCVWVQFSDFQCRHVKRWNIDYNKSPFFSPLSEYIYIYVYIYIYIHIYHHHHVPLARISLTLSCHFSLSFIASARSSGPHPVSSHSCCMYVRAGRPAFARPYVGVHRSKSLMSSSLLLQQCPAYLVRLTLIVFFMGGRWPYSWCFCGVLPPGLVQYCSQHSCVIAVQVAHPYSSIDTTTAWKKLHFLLSVRSDFHMIDSLSMAAHAFVSRVSMSFSVDETLLPR